MVCTSITITHRKWGDPRNAVIGFTSSAVDGRYAEGNQAWGWGGNGSPSDNEYLESVAIPKTLAYLGGKFQQVYGREMTRNDICGQESYIDPIQAAEDKANRLMSEVKEVQTAAIEAVKQADLQQQMLKSTTSIWANQDVYSQAMDTAGVSVNTANAAISEYNTLISKIEIPQEATQEATQEADIPKSETITDTLTSAGITVLLLPLGIIFVILILLVGRKK